MQYKNYSSLLRYNGIDASSKFLPHFSGHGVCADLLFLVRCVVVQNAIRLRTSKRDWICAVDSHDEKLDWITVIRKAIKSSL